MRRLTAVLEIGRIYIHDAEPAYDRPELIVRVWPTRFTRQDLATFTTNMPDHKAEDIRVMAFTHGYGYYLRFPHCGFDSEVRLAGDSRPMEVFSMPYPCPKVRAGIETRYYDGRWQKRLVSGWKDIS